jgi:long-subunit fatty acid transport protein
MKSLFILFTLWSLPSWAAYSNYNSILIGDLVAGMGGAGTAIVGDVAASSFYNPATLGFLDASAFSAAVGIYKKFDTLYGLEEDFTRAPMRVNQGFFRSLPSSVGSAIKAGDYLLALNVVVPDYDNFKGDLFNRGSDVSTLSFIDESLWVGASIAKKVSRHESFGLTLYYTARNYTRTVNNRTFTGATQARLFTSEKSKTDNTLVAILGYYLKLNDKTSIGLSLRPRSLRISSKVSVYESDTLIDTGTSTLSQNIINEPDRNGDVIIPGKLAIGVSHQPNPSWMLSGDLNIYEQASYEDMESDLFSDEVYHRPVINASIGAQYAWTDWFKVRTGVFTDYSSLRDPDADTRVQQDHVDMYGFSANFVFIAGNQIGYTFGGYYTGGKGIGRQRINQQYQELAKTQHIFTMLMGTSFDF